MVGRGPCSLVLGRLKYGKKGMGGFIGIVTPPDQASQTSTQALTVRVSGGHSSNSLANQIGLRHIDHRMASSISTRLESNLKFRGNNQRRPPTDPRVSDVERFKVVQRLLQELPRPMRRKWGLCSQLASSRPRLTTDDYLPIWRHSRLQEGVLCLRMWATRATTDRSTIPSQPPPSSTLFWEERELGERGIGTNSMLHVVHACFDLPASAGPRTLPSRLPPTFTCVQLSWSVSCGADV